VVVHVRARARACVSVFVGAWGGGCGVLVAPAVAGCIVQVRKIGYGAACARNESEQHRYEREACRLVFFLICCLLTLVSLCKKPESRDSSSSHSSCSKIIAYAQPAV
jgi:hypothetical protein